MANIVRKPGQIIFPKSLPAPFLIFTVVWSLGFIGIPCIIVLRQLSTQLSTLNISCKKVEPKIADCEFTQTPKIRLFPATVESYTGIRDIQYFQETETTRDSEGDEVTYTYHYIIFKQASGDNKVRYNGYYAQWAVGQISNFLNSQQETLLVSNSREMDIVIWGGIISSGIFVLVGFVVASAFIFYESIDINANIRQITEKRIGLPFYYKTINFSDVEGVLVSESTDSDGDKSYSVEIKYRSGNKQNKILVDEGLDQERIDSLGQEISRLIGCRLVPA